MDICLRALKESNKSWFDSCSVRNSLLIISHITFRDCRLHIFSDNLSRNSSILQLVKSPPPFHIPKAWKNYPFGRSLLVKAIIGSTPPGDLHYLKEKLHVYTINDIQLLKMYRRSCKSLGEQEHPRLEGSENLIILYQKENMGPWFSWLLGWLQPAQNQIFASSFRWTLKIQSKFGWWRHLITTSGILQ